MEHIRHLVDINSSIQSVYDAITTQEGLANWWTNQTLAKPEVHFLNEFRFGEDHLKKMRIVELIQNEKVSWVCEGDDDEWLNTPITFSLETKNDKTRLRFAHRNWAEATEYYETCNFHWAFFLKSLQLYCETGIGTPFG